MGSLDDLLTRNTWCYPYSCHFLHFSQKGNGLSYWQVSQCQGPCRVSKIEAESPQGDVQEGQGLMIIKLERYNEIRELLIENRTTRSQGHVCYQDGGQRVSVTMAAVHMGVEEMGM